MKEYIGDGVYADDDGFTIILTAENGIEATDKIYLEPHVLRGFASIKSGCKEDLTKPRSAVLTKRPLPQEKTLDKEKTKS